MARNVFAGFSTTIRGSGSGSIARNQVFRVTLLVATEIIQVRCLRLDDLTTKVSPTWFAERTETKHLCRHTNEVLSGKFLSNEIAVTAPGRAEFERPDHKFGASPAEVALWPADEAGFSRQVSCA